MQYDVALAACRSYEEQEVSAALEQAIGQAGGLDWVTPGMCVALKLNLVSAMKPEQAATVHPAVVCALTSASARICARIPLPTTLPASMTCSRASRSANGSRRVRSQAVSSRCWPSAARSWPGRSSS